MSDPSNGPAVAIEDVTILFGGDRRTALALADEGKDRKEIQSETGCTLGVHDAALEIAEGETLVLMGLSGSGKSTLLRAINGLAPVARGRVVLGAGEPADVTAAKGRRLRELRAERVAMVFQQFGLLPWRTVADNVGLGLELAGVPKKRRRERVEEQLSLVGLEGLGARPVGELSGGMQQRVGLARAFATDAPILLMDEPFSALDPLIRARLQDELMDLQRRLRRTIVFVSHDLAEAFKLGGRIAIMEGGRVVQIGTPREIYADPANDYVADFVAHLNPADVLVAEDVMVEDGAPPCSIAVPPETPLAEVMRALSDTECLRVEDGGGRTLGRIDRAGVLARLS